VKRKTGFVITDRHVTIKYLLGTLPEAERLRIEQAFFSADEAFEAMLAAEDELFGEYALDTLAPDQRAAFEARFLATPEGRRKLAFATALMEALERHTSVGAFRPTGWFARSRLDRPWLQVALVAAVFILAVSTAWLARDLARSRSAAAGVERIPRADLDRERAQRAQLERDLTAARTAPVAPLVVSVLLSPGLTRGSGDAGRITLASDADILRVQLDAARLAPGSYRATLRTAEGDVVWSGRVSRGPAAEVIDVDVPARLFSTHDYEMALGESSLAPAASYPLSVVRR
jgi:hypothetical protein